MLDRRIASLFTYRQVNRVNIQNMWICLLISTHDETLFDDLKRMFTKDMKDRWTEYKKDAICVSWNRRPFICGSVLGGMIIRGLPCIV